MTQTKAKAHREKVAQRAATVAENEATADLVAVPEVTLERLRMALSAAGQHAMLTDQANAVKNLSKEVRLSPLTELLVAAEKAAVDLLDRHAKRPIPVRAEGLREQRSTVPPLDWDF